MRGHLDASLSLTTSCERAGRGRKSVRGGTTSSNSKEHLRDLEHMLQLTLIAGCAIVVYGVSGRWLLKESSASKGRDVGDEEAEGERGLTGSRSNEPVWSCIAQAP